MVTLLLMRILESALPFAILGGLADVALQLDQGQKREAIIPEVIAGICIVVLAGAGYIAKKLLSKYHSDLHWDVTWTLTRKKPRARTQRRAKKVTRNRKPL